MSDPSQPKGERVLLVDDDPTNLHVLTQTLGGQGYRLLVAKDGASAINIARRARPALMLLDIMMPGMDGFQVCQTLKADPETENIAIIFLSALDDADHKVRGLKLGAVDYVSKPFHAEEVIARVNTHLTIHRLQQSLERANKALVEANARMKHDLDAAASVQRTLLPRALPENEAMRFAWAYHPCTELAGDALNLFWLDETHIGLYVLDVSGHGVPAALLSVAVTRSLVPHADSSSLVTEVGDDGTVRLVSPAEVVHRLNSINPMDTEAMLYFTIVYGVLDVQAREFLFTSAGHPGPIVLRADRPPELLEATGVPVGLMEDAEFGETRIELAPGDRMLLYTDGLFEEHDADGELYGLERLQCGMERRRDVPLQQSLEALVDDVIRWGADRRLDDDVAVLGVEVVA